MSARSLAICASALAIRRLAALIRDTRAALAVCALRSSAVALLQRWRALSLWFVLTVPTSPHSVCSDGTTCLRPTSTCSGSHLVEGHCSGRCPSFLLWVSLRGARQRCRRSPSPDRPP